MTGLQQVAVIIATTGLITTLVLPNRRTVELVTAGSKGLRGWQLATMGK